MYDVIIPCSVKDYSKLQYSVERLIKYASPTPDNIYIISKDRINIDGCQWVDERESIPIQKSEIRYRRPGWIYQQLIKLGQNITQNNDLCFDADVFLNSHIQFMIDDYFNIFMSDRDQYHKPYFDFMENELGVYRICNRTFICDFMMMKKSICREIIPNIREFFNRVNPRINDNYLLSEYELYGNYIYGDDYNLKFDCLDIKTGCYGEHHLIFNEEILRQCSIKVKDTEVFSIHTCT